MSDYVDFETNLTCALNMVPTRHRMVFCGDVPDEVYTIGYGYEDGQIYNVWVRSRIRGDIICSQDRKRPGFEINPEELRELLELAENDQNREIFRELGSA